MVQRVPTHVPGLDVLLGGGFLGSTINLVLGPPGTGKTLLSNQLAFAHAANGGRAIYVTHFGETHARMLSFLRTTTFFDEARVGKSVVYLSGVAALEREAMAGLLDMLDDALRSSPTLLVVDELVSAELFAQSPAIFKRFVHSLGARAEAVGCVVVLASTSGSPGMTHASAVVDGVIHLDRRRVGMRAMRELEVMKLRGSTLVPGAHQFEADHRGIVVYPRFEATHGTARPPLGQERERAPTGIAQLDEMTHGGWPRGSSTLVLGAAGSGKTVLALSFLAEGARRGEKGMHFGFYEAPENVIAVAENAGLRLGDTQIEWRPRREGLIDRMAHELLAEVDRHAMKRLVIDAMQGFAGAAVRDERMSEFFGALGNELRARGVTCMWTAETHEPMGPDIKLQVDELSALAENIVLLRCLESTAQLNRVLTIKKERGSAFDTGTRELWITDKGLRIAADSKSASALLGDGPFATNIEGRKG